MAKQTNIRGGIDGLNRALRSLAPEAGKQLRAASVEIAADVAREARNRALRVGGVARYVAPTIDATRDRVPVVKLGGTGRLPSTGRRRTGSRQTVGDVMWGAEFGGGRRPTTRQFLPHLGHRGYFLWPTVRERSDQTQETYSRALLKALGRI